MEPQKLILIQSEKAPQTASGKKIYQKPEIIYLAPLEAMAVVCEFPGKVDTFSCAFAAS